MLSDLSLHGSCTRQESLVVSCLIISWYGIQIDVDMYIKENVRGPCTLCIDGEFLRFSVFFVVIRIFENQFIIANFIPFALIVLRYFFDRVENKCMRTTVDIDSTDFKTVKVFSLSILPGVICRWTASSSDKSFGPIWIPLYAL